MKTKMNSMNRAMRSMSGMILAGVLIAVVGCGSSDNGSGATTTTTGATNQPAAGGKISLTGAGSTFVNPAMLKWVDEYKKSNPNIDINYQSIGSGAGIAQYTQGTVDFGATDAPVPDKDLGTMPPTIQVPVVAGPDVIVYNVPGVTNLKLSSGAIAGIFLGKIKTWNDPAIAADNAGAKLPSTAISVAHRSDGSGTTFIFTNYLSAVNADWKNGPGAGKTVDWPVGTGGKGNDEVAGIVQKTQGGIGYTELTYAIKNGLTYAQVKNASGEFITASPESTAIAANGAIEALKKDIRTPIVNSSVKGAYPICGFTYILVAKTPKDAAKSKALIDFLNWDLDSGQALLGDLKYAALPKELVDLNKTALSQVSSGN